jgi:hypothetical protein
MGSVVFSLLLQIWQDLFLDVSLAFGIIHGGGRTGARWMLWSKEVGPKVVVLPLFLDGMRRILVHDSTGTSPVDVS